MGQVPSSRFHTPDEDQGPNRLQAQEAERQSVNTPQGETRQSMSPSQSLSSHSYPPNEDQGYTHLHALEVERRRRNNRQRERRQLLSTSQRAESLARRRANYQIQRQMESTSVANQVEAMAGNNKKKTY